MNKIVLPIVAIAVSAFYVGLERTVLASAAVTTQETATALADNGTPLPDAKFRDGEYRGPQSDAFYGYVEVLAVIREGALAQVRIVHSPKSSGASLMINERAMPKLRKKAIVAQDAGVDFITGATLSSKAFNESLAAALRTARL